ncbi:MAG TPA: hypothetical protein VHZ76_10345 [Gammaproteobacteria bacterium]|jgi:hypothetical protein|nr:hypothetical protein [Gammaproteobacteria bacterium]
MSQTRPTNILIINHCDSDILPQLALDNNTVTNQQTQFIFTETNYLSMHEAFPKIKSASYDKIYITTEKDNLLFVETNLDYLMKAGYPLENVVLIGIVLQKNSAAEITLKKQLGDILLFLKIEFIQTRVTTLNKQTFIQILNSNMPDQTQSSPAPDTNLALPTRTSTSQMILQLVEQKEMIPETTASMPIIMQNGLDHTHTLAGDALPPDPINVLLLNYCHGSLSITSELAISNHPSLKDVTSITEIIPAKILRYGMNQQHPYHASRYRLAILVTDISADDHLRYKTIGNIILNLTSLGYNNNIVLLGVEFTNQSPNPNTRKTLQTIMDTLGMQLSITAPDVIPFDQTHMLAAINTQVNRLFSTNQHAQPSPEPIPISTPITDTGLTDEEKIKIAEFTQIERNTTPITAKEIHDIHEQAFPKEIKTAESSKAVFSLLEEHDAKGFPALPQKTLDKIATHTTKSRLKKYLLEKMPENTFAEKDKKYNLLKSLTTQDNIHYTLQHVIWHKRLGTEPSLQNGMRKALVKKENKLREELTQLQAGFVP